MEIVAEARNENAMQSASLKEEQRQIDALVPAGAPQNDPITKELLGALDSALKENRHARDLLDRLDQTMTRLGQVALAIRDIAKTESEFLGATRRITGVRSRSRRRLVVVRVPRPALGCFAFAQNPHKSASRVEIQT